MIFDYNFFSSPALASAFPPSFMDALIPEAK